MALPVNPVVKVEKVVHLPDLFPRIFPVTEVGPSNAKAAL
jgi:hypothetical protein